MRPVFRLLLGLVVSAMFAACDPPDGTAGDGCVTSPGHDAAVDAGFTWPDAAVGAVPCGAHTCAADEYCVDYMPAMYPDSGMASDASNSDPYHWCAPRTCDRTDGLWCSCVGCDRTALCGSFDPRTRAVRCSNE